MKTLAIIGSGLAGVSAGFFLKDEYEITFYERSGVAGGHTHIPSVKSPEGGYKGDAGFMVFHEKTYPQLSRFISEFHIPSTPVNLQFSIQYTPERIEFGSGSFGQFFYQPKNFINPHFWALYFQYNRLKKAGPDLLAGHQYQFHSVADYLNEKRYTQKFRNRLIYPLGSSVWYGEPARIAGMPLLTLMRFMNNFGFLGAHAQGKWRAVKGGGQAFCARLLSDFPGQILMNNKVTEIVREYGKVAVFDEQGQRKVYDKVILACHADQALGLLGESATPSERWLLKEFQYMRNPVILHHDPSVMPRNRGLWSFWNYSVKERKDGEEHLSMTYYLNSVHPGLSSPQHLFLTLNAHQEISADKILWQGDVEYPLLSLGAMKAQIDLPQLNEQGPLYFCGSYFHHGFHEDAFLSGLETARAVSGKKIWP